MWPLRALRGPFWYVFNIMMACWNFDLRDMADRPGQTLVRKFLYRSVMTLKVLLEASFLMLLIGTVGASAMVLLPARWVYLEMRVTWSP